MKKLILILILCSTAFAYDANDFATEVVSYTAGTGIFDDWMTYAWDGIEVKFNDPCTALGRPTIDTTGDKTPDGLWGSIDYFETVPVVGPYPACRFYELVSIGYGGQLTLKFNHPVSDDKNNPYGIDLIIFGNSRLPSGGWDNRDPNTFDTAPGYAEAPEEDSGIVSVSQDGVNWYTYQSLFSDNFAPTLGRVYDPCNPDTSIGSLNLWWGEPTDPTLPLDTALTKDDFDGITVAEAAILYGESAGGTGFDLAESGFSWIQYVRIDSDGDTVSEIDSISDVAGCGDYKHPFPDGDFSEDCIVDFYDLAMLGEKWQASEQDYMDLEDLTETWLDCTW